jgi:aminoglycoside N3'-acetyltransferase
VTERQAQTLLTKEDLTDSIHSLGVKDGDLLNVKASMRSIGKIKGGANTLIEALLECIGESGTIVTDSFVLVHSPFRKEFITTISTQNSPSYAGALANAMIEHPSSYRSFHPVQKFVLIGRYAKELAESHNENSYAYDILRIMAERNGKNLKIGSDEKVPGVGTTHVAIGISKLRQKRPLKGVRYQTQEGRIRTFFVNWSGGCMKSFIQLNALYKNSPGTVIGEGYVGRASSKLTSMKRTLELELDAIENDVEKFLRCGDPKCINCMLTWEPCHASLSSAISTAIRSGDLRMLRNILRVSIFARYPFENISPEKTI